jgi:hypothetical protein
LDFAGNHHMVIRSAAYSLQTPQKPRGLAQGQPNDDRFDHSRVLSPSPSPRFIQRLRVSIRSRPNSPKSRLCWLTSSSPRPAANARFIF